MSVSLVDLSFDADFDSVTCVENDSDGVGGGVIVRVLVRVGGGVTLLVAVGALLNEMVSDGRLEIDDEAEGVTESGDTVTTFVAREQRKDGRPSAALAHDVHT